MILDFNNYRLRPFTSTPDPVLIYPGLDLHVRTDKNNLFISGFRRTDVITVQLEDAKEALNLFRDIDIFLQYKTKDLPEYLL